MGPKKAWTPTLAHPNNFLHGHAPGAWCLPQRPPPWSPAPPSPRPTAARSSGRSVGPHKSWLWPRDLPKPEAFFCPMAMFGQTNCWFPPEPFDDPTGSMACRLLVVHILRTVPGIPYTGPTEATRAHCSQGDQNNVGAPVLGAWSQETFARFFPPPSFQFCCQAPKPQSPKAPKPQSLKA